MLWLPIAGLVGAAWFLYGLFEAVRGELPPETQERLRLVKWIPHLPWWAWVIGALVIVCAAILEGSYRVIRELEPNGSRITVRRVTLERAIGAPLVCRAFFENIGDEDARLIMIGNVGPVQGISPKLEGQTSERVWQHFRHAIDHMGGNLRPNRTERRHSSFHQENIGPDWDIPDESHFAHDSWWIYCVGTVIYEDSTGVYHTDYCRYFTVTSSGDPFTASVHNDEHVPTDQATAFHPVPSD